MPPCGCPDRKLPDGSIQKCQCGPCSSGQLSDCTCNKSTGCACQGISVKACVCGDGCSCNDCVCGKASTEVKKSGEGKGSCCS
ncbi:hypothetical protein BT69DRAFT_1208810, partial [Atractiella rhizophila]